MNAAPVLKSSAGDAIALQPGKTLVVKPKPGTKYRLVREGDAAGAAGLEVVASRQGDNLHLKTTSGEVVLEGFYGECKAGACGVELPSGAAGPYVLDTEAATGTALGDGSQLVYAYGPTDTLSTLVPNTSGSGWTTAGTNSTYAAAGSDTGMGWKAAAVAGGVGLAAIAASGGSDGGGSPAAQDTVLNGNVVAGPVLAGHNLKIVAYRADGTVLVSGDVNPDGTFSLTLPGSYTGPVLVLVFDSAAGPDYYDEATQTPKDLGSDLRAATVIPAPGVYNVNLNALTELAVREMGLGGGDGGNSGVSLAGITASQITAANQSVAQAVGLGGQDLVTGSAPNAIVDTGGTANPQVNDYGRLLAALSGAEAQAGTLDAALTTLLPQLANGQLTGAGLQTLLDGAARLGGPLVDAVSDLTNQATAVHIDSVGDNSINAAEVANGLTLTGTNAAGAAVTVTIGGQTWTATVTGTTWSLTLTAMQAGGLPQGAVLVSASSTVGSTTESATRGIYVDTLAPAAPTLDPLTTNDTTPVLQGSADAGARLTVAVGGASYSVVADANGRWTLDTGTATPASGTLALAPDGAKTVTLTATDAAGNTATSSPNFTLDTAAPAVPTVAAGTTNDTTPVLTGTAEAGSTVKVEVGGATYTVTANGNGLWTLDTGTATPTSGTFNLGADGLKPVTLTSTDAAGNARSGEGAFTLDATAPAAPVLTTASTNDTTPVLAGTAEAGSAVTVTVGGATYTLVADTNGHWSVDTGTATPVSGTFSLGVDGAKGVTLTSTDAGGTTTAGSGNFTLDTAAPAAPTLTALTTNDPTPVLAGTAEANSTVTVVVGGATYTTTADVNGAWTVDTGVAVPTSGSFGLGIDGSKPVTLTSTDAAGNATPGAGSFTLDTTGPTAPTLTPQSTNDTTPVLAGTAEANSTVTVVVGGATYTTTANGSGAWTLDTGTAVPTSGSFALGVDGLKAVTLTSTDGGGNTTSGNGSFTLDTTGPVAPTVTAQTTNDTTPVLAGTAEANSTVTIVVGGATYTTTANGSGAWTLDTGVAVPTSGAFSLGADGTKTVTLTSTDAAGNGTPGVGSITLDTTPPAAPTVDSLTTNDTTPVLGGTSDVNTIVTVTVGGATYSVATNNAGRWTLDTGTATPVSGTLSLGADGSKAVTLSSSDAAGNSTGGNGSITLDTAAPTISSSTPADNASTVAAQGDIVLTFNEAVTAGTGNIVITNGAGDVRTISITDSTQVTITGNTVTINPTAALLGLTGYSVQIDAGAVRDAAGNNHAGIADTTTLNFTTGLLPLQLSGLAGGGFAIVGEYGGSRAGFSVSSAGDFNGDGYDDVIVGAGYNSGSNPGRAFVVLGGSAGGTVELSSVVAASNGFFVTGEAADNDLGQSVSGAGDVNGDGFDDIIVSARWNSAVANFAGRSYVIYGNSNPTAPIELSDINAGNGGFSIRGQQAFERSGQSVSSAGDVNGDGLDDLIVGAPSANNPSGNASGRSYVVFGQTGSTSIDVTSVSAGNGGFSIIGELPTSLSGYSVSSAGDVNNDGLADLLVGTYRSGSGRAYVVFGKTDTAAVNLSDVSAGVGGFVVKGDAAVGDYLGWSVSQAGDVNGDGFADIIAGSPLSGTYDGVSMVVFGRSSTASVDLSAPGTNGFVIRGASDGQAGYAVSGAGDLNGDGLDDLIVGGLTTNDATGRSYVVFGHTGTADVQLSEVALGIGGFIVEGVNNYDYSGVSVASAGDVNGDGLADLLVGARDANGGNGGAYVIYGGTSGVFANTFVSQLGTNGNDTLSDSGTSQTIVGGEGDDTITLTAASIASGGAGNDTIVIDATTVTGLQAAFGAGGNVDRLSRIDGGTGFDRVVLSGNGITFDLTAISNVAGGAHDASSRLDSIEAIDLSGLGNNTLVLRAGDVLDMSPQAFYSSTARHELIVDGDAGDTLDLGDGAGTTGWTLGSQTTINGVTYDTWTNDDSLVAVFANQDVSVI